MNCRMEKTREETREDASRGIADNNNGRGARGQQDERGVTRGQPGREGEPRGKNKERRKLMDQRGCIYKEGNKDKVPDSIRRNSLFTYHTVM
jgi:hypothetical protein